MFHCAAGILSGEYESDFEPTLDEMDWRRLQGGRDEKEEGGEEEKEGGEEERGENGGGEVEDSLDELAVSFNDISVLRRSLEEDQIIRSSLREKGTEQTKV